MTATRAWTQPCPSCGGPLHFTLFTSLNVTLNPELRRRLFDGELSSTTCGRCRKEGVMGAYPLLYHDMKERLLIQVFNAAWPYGDQSRRMLDAIVPAAQTGLFAQQGYRMRIVFDFADLAEKVAILEAGLDDRAIEWIKAVMVADYRKSAEQAARTGEAFPELLEPRFQGIDPVSAPDRALHIRGPFMLGPFPATMRTPMALYERAVAHLDAHLPWPVPLCGAFYKVDPAYVEPRLAGLPSLGVAG